MSDSLGGGFGGWLKDPNRIPLIMGLLGGMGGLGAGMARGGGAAGAMTAQGIMGGMQQGQAFGQMQQDQMLRQALAAPDDQVASLSPQQQQVRSALGDMDPRLRQLAPILGVDTTRQALTSMLTRDRPETWNVLDDVEARRLRLPEGGAYERSSLGQTRQVARTPDWMNPGYRDFQAYISSLRAPRVNVNTNLPPVESAAQKAYGEAVGGRMAGVDAAGAQARGALPNLDLAGRLLEQVQTGPLAGAQNRLGAVAQQLGVPPEALRGLGMDPETTGTREQLASVLTQNVLNSMGGRMGAGVSNADREFMTAAQANLAGTPEGNAAIISMQRAAAQRQLVVQQSLQQHLRQNGISADSFLRWETETLPQIERQPLVDDGLRERVARAAAARRPQSGAAGAGRAQQEIVPPPEAASGGEPVMRFDAQGRRIR